jgi:hypothetical protein
LDVLAGDVACVISINTMNVNVSYTQIAVFVAGIGSPFNNWTGAHVNQGFAWRSEAVSFRALKDGDTKIEIEHKSQIALRGGTIRAIQVPFSVPSSGELEIASIADGFRLEMPPGEYALIFEAGYDENLVQECFLSFVPAIKCTAKVLRADADLAVPSSLLMTAEPA